MVKLYQKKPKFCINDHPDIVIEVLKRLDDRSLGVAACVCRLWCSISRNETLWENLCFCQVSPPPADVRPVVIALGGYRRLYMACLRPVLSRLSLCTGSSSSSSSSSSTESDRVGSAWTRDQVQLSLSLFCVDYYERLGSRLGEASSLMFLCKPVNVG